MVGEANHTQVRLTFPSAAPVRDPPQRVVTLGFNDQDFALALGVVPVATREYLSYDYQSRPWAQVLLPDEPLPTLGGQELDLEAVAAAEPDLNLAIYSFIDESIYGNLARIAPTVAQSGDHEVGGMPWQEQLLSTGRALGLQDRAAALVDEVEGEFTSAREQHPEFEGLTLAVAFVFDGEFFILQPSDLRARFFQDLGFEMPATAGEISQEQLSLLDQDVLAVLGTTPDACRTTPSSGRSRSSPRAAPSSSASSATTSAARSASAAR